MNAQTALAARVAELENCNLSRKEAEAQAATEFDQKALAAAWDGPCDCVIRRLRERSIVELKEKNAELLAALQGMLDSQDGEDFGAKIRAAREAIAKCTT